MSKEDDLKHKLWKELKSEMTIMVGLVSEHGRSRPLTAQIEEEGGPIWFFTAKDTELVKKMGRSAPAAAHFVSKGHDLFACIDGTMTLDNDKAVIGRLWNKFIAAWYPGGKTDPSLALVRFDAANAEIWLNDSSLLAGIRMLLGSDPKEDYKDKVAVVNLR